MKILYPVSLAEFLKITGGALWVHNARAVVLREDVPADRLTGLFGAELLQELQHMRANVYSAGLAVFGAGEINTVFWGVLSVAADGNCLIPPVNV